MLHLRGTVLPDGERHDVWITEGRISFQPVTGAHTLAEDVFLLPGLVDAHCHPGLGPHGATTLDEAAEQARTDRDAGTLLIRDCGVPIDLRPLQDRDDMPRIIRAGRHLTRPKRYIPELGIDVDPPEDLPRVVTEQAKASDGWVKLVGDWIDRGVGDLAPVWPDDVLVAAIEAAHAAGARVTAHVFGEDAMLGLIESGIDCLEHGTGLRPEMLAEMGRRGTSLVPTLVNIENFPDIAAKATRYPDYAEHMRSLHAGVADMVASALEAGVSVYAGTDAGGGVAHGRLVDEIEALHRVGMSREDALASASWAAREWLGYEGITEGAPADLIVFDEDPRADLGVLRKPRHIVLRGALLPRH